MSVNVQDVRGFVMDRLAVAADEIFALFERTFAEFEEELVHKLLLQPRVLLYREDIKPVTVGVDVFCDQDTNEEPIEVKEEVNPPIRNQDPSARLKSEGAETGTQPTGAQREGEEPGCSSDLNLDNKKGPSICSDTEDSWDWENPGEEQKQSGMKDTGNENGDNGLNAESNDDDDDGEEEENSLIIIHRCSQCETRFKNADDLELHLQVHPGPFTCQICHKQYGQKNPYRIHVQRHASKKPFRCPVCRRMFTQSGHRNSHMRIHTGEKPFKCSDCGLCFRQKNALTRHILAKHSEHRPFRCSLCQKGFVQKYNYQVHVRKHKVKDHAAAQT